MEKLDGTSMNLVQENAKKLKEIFPEIFVEDKIDFDLLEQICCGGGVQKLEDSKERYSLTWNGKSEARQIAQEVSTGTLKPAKEESKDWDNTENIYIEGDNLEVLKLLQKSYHGKIKMIYIDPPYNTGKDFVYKDNFKDNIENYKKVTGQVSEEGTKLTTNTDTDGRYHSNWLNMMYPRLKLARNLLTDDGVIFISIDDNEQANLKKLCDEIFGEENFVAMAPRKTGVGSAATNSDSELRKLNDFIFIYLKSREVKFRKNIKGTRKYPYEDINGKYELVKLQASGSDATRRARPKMYYSIYLREDGSLTTNMNKENIVKEIIPNKVNEEDGRWIWGKERFEEMKERFTYYDGETIYRKVYYDENEDQNVYQVEKAWFDSFTNAQGTKEFDELFKKKKIFSHPKPVDLIKLLINLSNKENNFLVLDFFSGSATTAHSVMQLNAEDGGTRKYIMVQLPELCDDDSEAYKAGYKNICEIGKERIRRAGEKIKSDESLPIENREKLDVGFKVFKLDSTNIKEWDIDTENLQQSLLDSIENIKSDRSSLDVLYEILLKYGLDLNIPIEENKDFYSIGGGSLLVSLNKEINNEVINSICEEYKKLQEIDKEFKTTVILRDNSFKNDVDKTNAIKKLEQVGINEIRSI